MSKPKTVTAAEFDADPSAVYDYATHHGPVAVLDSTGKHTMTVVVPRNVGHELSPGPEDSEGLVRMYRDNPTIRNSQCVTNDDFLNVIDRLTAERDAARADAAKLRSELAEFVDATSALLDWMNNNDLSADHADAMPEDYERLCRALTQARLAVEAGK